MASRFPGLMLAAIALAGAAPAAAQAPASAVQRPATEAYVLGPGDVVEIAVLGQADFTTRTRIAEDGSVQLPYLGKIAAANVTAGALGEDVRARLSSGGYYPNPIVRVDIASYASRYVTVLGLVATPGLVPVDRAYRLSEILARVGSVREGAADYVILRPASGPEIRYQIDQLAVGDTTQDPYVAPGDKIYAPKAEVVYVTGQVKAPGSYPLKTGATFGTAIAMGGGVTDQGSQSRLQVTRDGKRLSRVNLSDKVQPGDVILVRERIF